MRKERVVELNIPEDLIPRSLPANKVEKPPKQTDPKLPNPQNLDRRRQMRRVTNSGK